MLVRFEGVIGPRRPMSDSERLTVGRTYHVLEFLVLPGKEPIVRILDDTTSSALWTLSMFAQVTSSVPSNWTVQLLDGGGVEFSPARWSELGFWDSYFDGDQVAEAIFAEELAIIRACDPVGTSGRRYPMPIDEHDLWQLLRHADDPNHLEYPADHDHRGSRNRFDQLARRLDLDFGCEVDVDRDIHDASMHGRITVPARATAAGRPLVVVVSNFAELAVLAISNPGMWTAAQTARLLHPDDADRMYAALGDLGYVLIPEEPLWLPYDGACDPAIFTTAEPTWWTRFFDYL